MRIGDDVSIEFSDLGQQTATAPAPVPATGPTATDWIKTGADVIKTGFDIVAQQRQERRERRIPRIAPPPPPSYIPTAAPAVRTGLGTTEIVLIAGGGLVLIVAAYFLLK